ncbi:MAG: ferredoxin--NADP reductase [Myxococcota bacterium]
MKANVERVIHVHHWNDSLFTIRTTRNMGLRFRAGQFVMMGLQLDDADKPLMRAYSFVNAPYDDELEFYSIKVPDGPLTSRLQHIKIGDEVLVGLRPTGTLVLPTLLPGRNLYCLATGTGLAPFMSIIRDPDTYERYENVILVHGVRHVSDLGYHDMILNELPEHPWVGEMVRQQLLYYPTVTREIFNTRGRITEQLASGQLTRSLDLPDLESGRDRVMLCGSPDMVRDLRAMLDERGFTMGTAASPGGYAYERAFAD